MSFAEKKIHPGDLKSAASKYINDLLDPIRSKFSTAENIKLVLSAYPEDASKLEIIAKAMKDLKIPDSQQKREDFSRFDLRVGKILEVRRHPDADKLLIETIDVGEEKPRTILSGIAEHFNPEDLVNRKVVVFCNLKPAAMRGIESLGMIAAASSETKLELVEPPSSSSPGDPVYVQEYNYVKSEELIDGRKKDKNLFDQVFSEWKTDDQCRVVYKGLPMKAGSGICKVQTLTHAKIR